jgi:type I restriction enzyme S subunit
MKAHSWVEVPLEDISAPCSYPIGDGDHGAIKPSMYVTSGIPYIRVADIVEGEILRDKLVYITPDVHQDNPKSHLFPNDIVISKTGATIGKVALIPPDMTQANTTSSVGKITVDQKKALPRYVLYYMRSPRFQRDMWAVSHKSAQPGFNIKDLKKFIIPLPPLADQERIVKLLDEADELRKLRTQADRRTSSLIPALFHEMFGNPATNPMGWPYVSMEEVAARERYAIVDGPFGASLKQGDYKDSGVPVIRIKNITAEGQFMDDNFLYISDEKYEELKRSAVHVGDILISRVGTIGNTCIYPGRYKKALLSTTGVCKITVDERRIDQVFLHSLMLTGPFQQQIKRSASSAVQPYFNLTALRNWRLVLPPLALQKEFATRVSEIRWLESEQAASRLRLDALFQSLLHHAFSGDL